MVGSNSKNRKNDFEEALRQFIDAQMRGEKPDIEEFVDKFPEFEDQIRLKVQSFQRIDALFDTILQVGDNGLRYTATGVDLVGHQIGSFEIVEMIGRGGMGVVYLARDTKLDRLVAIKSMPPELQANSTARTRFMREARLLASLSHPNIGVIHDIIEQDEGSAYLVLEYVPGETLAERMAREPLQLKDALSLGLQVAEAVCAAHEAGVIHRDLKPSNIKITPDGRVKVLDFGLAKVTVSKNVASEPTVTQAGRVMGTPAYMSPEQARGNPTDRRTDIWSFGCLLYEMLTGHLPFEGETTTDVLARIIEREPDWDLLPEGTPSSIRVLVWRCLAKDPRRRLQHIGDAVLELDETLNVPQDKPSIAKPTVKVATRLLWGLGIVCTVAGLIVGIIAESVFLRKPAIPSSPLPMHRTVINLPENQVLGVFHSTVFGVRQPAFALSPDGSRLVYVAHIDNDTQLFLRPMNQIEAKPISGTEGASLPFFSPDGRSVGFFADEELKVVSLLGQEPITICIVSYPQTGSWGDDDMIYFTGGEGGGLSRVPAAGGDIELLGTDADPITGIYPQVLPGGKAVLISSEEGAELFSLETMQREILVPGVRYARYIPTGHLVYVRAGAIEAVSFNLATLQVMGPFVPVIDKVLSDSVRGAAQYAFSNNGLLVYVPGGDIGKSKPVWVDRQGNEEPLAMPVQTYGTPKLSPDGKKLAIVVEELKSNVYVYDVAEGMPTKLTLEGNNGAPVWTPDGKRITFWSDRAGHTQNIFWKPVDGNSKAELFYSGQHILAPSSWSLDGNRLALYSSNADIYVLSLNGPRELEPVLTTDFTEIQPVFSPDGRYIAYTSNKDGDFHVYVCPYPKKDWVKRISPEFGEEPIWSASGDELFYRSRSKWMVVSISTEPEFKAGTPEMVFEGPYANVLGFSYDVAPDGQRLLVLKPQFDDSQVRELHVVTNWFEELKRLAPPGKE